MLKIGITGSIGSGKSTVCRIFETLGVPVYYADERGRYLLANNDRVKAEVLEKFGESVLDSQGHIDRALLASVVFSTSEKLAVLERIVHPAVFDDFRQWASRQTTSYIVKEAALLFESGSYKELDKMVTVTAPLETRIQRVAMRDKLTREQVMARESRQWPDERKKSTADYVIQNDETWVLAPQVLELHRLFLSLAGLVQNPPGR